MMKFGDNLFMADAIARANDMGNIARDAIAFSAWESNGEEDSDFDADDNDCEENDDEDSDSENRYIDPKRIEAKIAFLRSEIARREPACERIRRRAKRRPLTLWESGPLQMQEIYREEIDRLTTLLAQQQTHTTDT